MSPKPRPLDPTGCWLMQCPKEFNTQNCSSTSMNKYQYDDFENKGFVQYIIVTRLLRDSMPCWAFGSTKHTVMRQPVNKYREDQRPARVHRVSTCSSQQLIDDWTNTPPCCTPLYSASLKRTTLP